MDIKSKRNKRPREIDVSHGQISGSSHGYGGSESGVQGPPSTARRGSSMSSLPAGSSTGYRDNGGHAPGLSPAAAAAASLHELSHLKFGAQHGTISPVANGSSSSSSHRNLQVSKTHHPPCHSLLLLTSPRPSLPLSPSPL